MQIVNFCILLWLLNKFLFKPLAEYLNKREQTIRTNIEEAEQDKEKAESILAEQKTLLANAYEEAKEIRNTTKSAAEKEKEVLIQKAKDEAEGLVNKAKTEIESHAETVKSDLTNSIGKIAVELSGQIIDKNIDEKEQESIIKNYLTKA